MKDITIDCSLFSCREDVHRAFAETLSFPTHYGNNLDALHDCLTEIGSDTQIQLLHWNHAESQIGSFCKILKTVLDMCCKENACLHIDYC